MSEHLRQLTPAARLLGRELLAVDPQAGTIRVRFFARDEFANRHGSVHGGFLAAMLDSLASNAVLAALPPGRTLVTTRLDTCYLKPAALGEIVGVARVVSRDDRDAVVEGELTDATGRVVATARVEFRMMARKEKQREAARPD